VREGANGLLGAGSVAETRQIFRERVTPIRRLPCIAGTLAITISRAGMTRVRWRTMMPRF
jgi:hypothetical protein